MHLFENTVSSSVLLNQYSYLSHLCSIVILSRITSVPRSFNKRPTSTNDSLIIENISTSFNTFVSILQSIVCVLFYWNIIYSVTKHVPALRTKERSLQVFPVKISQYPFNEYQTARATEELGNCILGNTNSRERTRWFFHRVPMQLSGKIEFP